MRLSKTISVLLIVLPLGLIPWRQILVIEPLFRITIEELLLIAFCMYGLLCASREFGAMVRGGAWKVGTLNTVLFLYLLGVGISFVQGLINADLKYEPLRQMKGMSLFISLYFLQRVVDGVKELNSLMKLLLSLAFLCAAFQCVFLLYPQTIDFFKDSYVVSKQSVILGFPKVFYSGSIFFLPLLPMLLAFAFDRTIGKRQRFFIMGAYVTLLTVFSLTLIYNLIAQNILAAILILVTRLRKTVNWFPVVKLSVIAVLLSIGLFATVPVMQKLPSIAVEKYKGSAISLSEGNFAYRVQQIPKIWSRMSEIDLGMLFGIGLGTGYETDLVYSWDHSRKYMAPTLEFNHLNNFFITGIFGFVGYLILTAYFTVACVVQYLRVKHTRLMPYQLSVMVIWLTGLLNPYGGYFWYSQGVLLLVILFLIHTVVGREYRKMSDRRQTEVSFA